MINPSLDNISRLLGELGNPQETLSAIQVTGTNGKSSTSWMTGQILAEHGIMTGVYTSPHLESFCERLRLNGTEVSEEMLARYLSEVGEIVDRIEAAVGADEGDRAVSGTAAGDGAASDAPPPGSRRMSGFEILTAAVFELMRRERFETAVFEVGMGGRWDATSLADVKVAVITHVALDHTEYLGADEGAIAAEKSQIVRSGGIAVCGEKVPYLSRIFEARAADVGSQLLLIDRDFSFDFERVVDGRLVTVNGSRGVYRDLLLKVAGDHQVDNLALAVVASEAYLGRALDIRAVKRAASTFRIPGRFEIMGERPWIVLDGAHNPDAASVLAKTLTKPQRGSERTPELIYEGLTLVIGILGDKDSLGILQELVPLADRVVVTEADSPRRLPAAELANKIRSLWDIPVWTEPELGTALRVAAKISRPEDLICVTGSLYTVGAARPLIRGNHSWSFFKT